MADFQLNSNLDLAFDSSGGLLLTPSIAHACAQTLIIGLSTFLGEWAFDTSQGVPYTQEIFLLVPEDATIRAIYAKKIQANRYVRALTKLNIDVDRATRALGVDFEVLAIDGSTVRVSSAGFIIDGQVVVDGVIVVIDGIPVVIS